MNSLILTINPGSTSTKISLFEGEASLWGETLRHDPQVLAKWDRVAEQYAFRKAAVLAALEAHAASLADLTAVVGRGGILKPMCGGTYKINNLMLQELHQGKWGEHASNLGAILAHAIAEPLGIPCFIVDPTTVDEMEPVAKITGIPELTRKSIFHALNQKAVARRTAEKLSKDYGNCRLVVAHLGGGISVGAHLNGRVVDVNNALDGEGPFTPERSGGLPVGDLLRLANSGKFTLEEMQKRINGKGGLVAYLGTNDAQLIGERAQQGDEQAKLLLQAMAYQVAKEIGACATVLQGQIDAIVITGGLAHSALLVEEITKSISYLGKIFIFPGEDEMQALADGGRRILSGQEQSKDYA
ncbi:MAG TPA: butyrate kinase [Candidatus Deferrimicrobium sp.]|nr:butyrate kinase [Candidatus Deferrimicrobium sp.]